MIHFYFDMDGVLSIFDESACLEKPFNRPGSHYFRTCEPDRRAIDLFRTASRATGAKTHVLTRIYLEIEDPDALASCVNEADADKSEWLREHIGNNVDYIPLRQTKSKSMTLSDIPRAERRRHVLIDDDPNILQDWANAGGAGVQWIQSGRKVDRWENGPVLGPSVSVQDAGAILWHAAHGRI